MNKAILTGVLGKDPQVKESQNGNKVARYSLAVKRKFAKEGEPDTDWISIVAFGKTAEFVEKYLKKGTKIMVVGHILTGEYTNKDGAKVYTTDVVADEHEFMESKKSAESSGEPKPATEKPDDSFVDVEGDVDDDLPFD